MPVFRYKAYRPDGTRTEGTIEAAGYADALTKIKSEGLFAEDIREQPLSSLKNGCKIATERFLPSFSRNLSILLESGVTLLEALDSLAAEATGRERELIISIKERVSAGAAFHRSLEDFSGVFPDFYISMVQAGEKSASLERVLRRLAQYLEAQEALKARVKNAFIYPLFMLIVSSVVLSFIFIFVIPKITKIFRDTNAPLPLITKALITLSSFMVNYWWLVFIVLIAFVFLVERILPKKRRLFDRLILKMPGGIVQSLYYSRFARTLAYLVEGGVPLLAALRFASRSTGNSEIEASIARAEESVAEGLSLSSSLKGFPPLFIQLIATGEKGGRLFETLSKASEIYEEEFNKRVTRMVSIFEPAIIVAMGIIVCVIVLAVLLPLFQINQLIR